MNNSAKPSIVFCHGIWADGSSFRKVIPPLQAAGYQVIAAQYGLNSNDDDVATVKTALGRVNSPAILVGHSYGGSVITAAGTDDRVIGLVYVAALAPDAGLFNKNAPGVAWKTKPSWYIVSKNDHTVHPDLERFFAKRMGAKVTELDSSHVSMLSHPDDVVKVIRMAAETARVPVA